MTKAKKLRQLFDVAFLLFILIFFGETVITAIAYDENKSDGIFGFKRLSICNNMVCRYGR